MSSSKLRKFLIIFDNPSLLYFPGQFLTGKVLVDLDQDATFEGLFFHVVGEGCLKLKQRGQKHVLEKENYIDFRLRLFGEPGQAPTVLSSGIHSFPFKLGLPHDLPSTFLGQYGWIQFYCKTSLAERTGLVHKNQQVFIVMNPIDLNREPAITHEPVHRETEHLIGSSTCFGRSGKILCRVRLDKSGFVPGELIHIWARVDNQSTTTIRNTRAVLNETVQYISRGKIVKSEVRDLAVLSKSKIKARGKAEWIDEKLQVPPLPPTNLRASHLIKISYNLLFLIYPTGFQKAVSVRIPVTIATYPFGERDESFTPYTGDGTDKKFPTILPVYRSKTKPGTNR